MFLEKRPWTLLVATRVWLWPLIEQIIGQNNYWEGVLYKRCSKTHKKISTMESTVCNSTKTELHFRCFPLKFAEIFRTAFL